MLNAGAAACGVVIPAGSDGAVPQACISSIPASTPARARPPHSQRALFVRPDVAGVFLTHRRPRFQ